MPKDVLITPASGLVEFKTDTVLKAKIELDASDNLVISNPGGNLAIGNTATDVYIGDGIASVDIIYEQSGDIRALTGKTLTIGQADSNVAIASPTTITGQFVSTRANNTATGAGQIYLNGATGNRIDFNQNGVAAPTTTTRSVGTKLVLWPAVDATQVDYAIGIESGTLWNSVAGSGNQFKWYAGTSNVMTLSGTGALSATSFNGAGAFSSLSATGQITVNTTTNNQSYTTTGAGTITITSGTAGNINNMNIGATTAGSGAFTSLTNTNGATIGTAQGANAITLGGGGATGNITVGQSTASQSVRIANGVTASGNTKTVEIGANGAAGSTTNITIGSTAGTNNTTINGNASVTGTFTPHGYAFKACATVATTAALTLNTAQTTIDGITITATDRVLVKNQTNAAQNGIYTNLTTTTWTRVADADTASELSGAIISIDRGTINGGKVFKTGFKATDTLGTTNMSWDELGQTASSELIRQEFTATAAQTSFTISGGYNSSTDVIQVYFNGVLLDSTDYTATNGTSVVLTTGAEAGDIVTVNIIKRLLIGTVASTADISRQEFLATAGQTTFTIAGGYSVASDKIFVYFNGILLDAGDYTATNGTTVVLGFSAAVNDSVLIVVIRSVFLSISAPSISDNTTTNAVYYPTISPATSGAQPLQVSSTKLTFNPSTGVLSSTDFNSTSDVRTKQNISTVKGLDVVTKLRGVEFDFIDSGKHTSGVIAQEIEEVLPHIVNNDQEIKSVSYQQIIAYLIESIKELNIEIQELKKNQRGNA